MKKAIALGGFILLGSFAIYGLQGRENTSEKAQESGAVTTTIKVNHALTCCGYRAKDGFLGRVKNSTLVVRGEVRRGQNDEAGQPIQLTIGKVLYGEESKGLVSLETSFEDPHFIANQSCLYFLNPTEGGYAPLAVIPCEKKQSSVFDAIVTESVAYLETANVDRIAKAGAALFNAYKVGDSAVRDMLSRDFVKYPELIKSLGADEVQALQNLLIAMNGNDPSLGGLVLMLGYRHDHQGTRGALVGCLEKDGLNKGFPALLRVIQRRDKNAYCAAILQRWETTDSRATQERMAKVLARLGVAEGREHLEPFLNSSAAASLQAEALIAFAGQDKAEAKSLALDVIRKHLGPKVSEENKMALILKDRQRRSILEGVPSGERYRLMAAGYYIAKMKDEKARTWLKGKLDFLDDAGCADFIKDRLANRWADFDAPF